MLILRKLHPRVRKPLTAALALVAGAGLAAAVVVPAEAAVPPVLQKNSKVVTADSLATAQIDGVVWKQAIAGNTVFAGGQFTTARPAGAAPGTKTVRRYNLMSYDVRTGRMTSFAPKLNGQVLALAVSPDKKTLYVGGDFTKVGTTGRWRFAAFSVATGKLLKYKLALNGQVTALTTVKDTVYLGGRFTAVGSTKRSKAAAINVATNKLTRWNPSPNAHVKALVGTPDGKRIVLGGAFSTLKGKANPGMGAVTAGLGTVGTWKINTKIKNSGTHAAVWSLAADSDTIYGTTYGYQSGNFEGVFAATPKTGSIRWLQDCHGDQYGVAPVGDRVYSVGHAHFCTNIGGFGQIDPQRALVVTKAARGTVATNTQPGSSYGDWGGYRAPALYNWFPRINSGSFTGLNQGPWSIVASSGYVAVAGEFTMVNGKRQQGLVRFAVPAKGAPRKIGPQVTGSAAAPKLYAAQGGGIAVGWSANYDLDDTTLHYSVLRDGKVIATLSRKSTFFRRPGLAYTDRSARSGVTYTYQVRVRDGDGNTVTSSKVSRRA